MSLTFVEHAPLKPHNTFGVAVSARWFTTLSELADLPALIASAPYREGPVLFLGGGSNLLFTRDYPGLVVKLALSGVRKIAEDETSVVVEAAAGEPWHPFVQRTLAEGWYGLENLSLIPGTVGAAPIQNIGAYGVEVKDALTEVVCADLHHGGAPLTLANADCRFGYRDSVFKHEAAGRLLVTAVRFRLSKTPQLKTGYGDIAGELSRMGVTEPTPRDVADAVIRIRQSKLPDPARLGNAGSFFKNPVVDAAAAALLLERFPTLPHYPAGDGRVKLAAGWLIDNAGLKGHRVGDAAVHERQALVLVNHGGASGQQIRALAATVQDAVRERYGVLIEPEPVVL
ncbi:UDP-N-acetylmuramate dehydrogenase [Crenobacter luteus]|uniref:UDP-N-acetylmuramate dehydrogenase n=1 Tax=Crenobacter luteus TaxID=1452487 RepID=UPI00104DDC99|nr:UDP-N-acetylmuramate dehydrogenase [Crenobacter luteus]TCP14493.1 UDP-N-acetylmuramate dehydrogenase [Crenobacter luteus]